MADVTREQVCDWCGEKFVGGEYYVLGYEDAPTHKACARAARRAYREDRLRLHGESFEYEQEREPFVDWPNGQGTYD